MFMLYGASYALLNPVWGWAADRVSSALVILAGAVLLGAGCLLVGPVPGLGLQPSYPLTVTAIIIAGQSWRLLLYTSHTLHSHSRFRAGRAAGGGLLRGPARGARPRLPRQPDHLRSGLQHLDLHLRARRLRGPHRRGLPLRPRGLPLVHALPRGLEHGGGPRRRLHHALQVRRDRGKYLIESH